MTEKTRSCLTSIHLFFPDFRRLELLCECAVCGLITSVAIERGEDGMLSWSSPNESERFHVQKKSAYSPYAALTQRGSLSILCGQCISIAKNKEEHISRRVSEDVGTSFTNGKSEYGSRCLSRNHEGFTCSYPQGHPGMSPTTDHEHKKQGLTYARWKGDFDGGYYFNVLSSTPGIDKAVAPTPRTPKA
jgi:hypothetical protein